MPERTPSILESRLSRAVICALAVGLFTIIFGPSVLAQFARQTGPVGWGQGYGHGYGIGYGWDGGEYAGYSFSGGTEDYTAEAAAFAPRTFDEGASPVVFHHTDDVYPVEDEGMSDAITLPFAFQFYGRTYSRVYVDTNGFLSFNGNDCGANADEEESGLCWVRKPIPTAAPPNNAIFGMWRDNLDVPAYPGDPDGSGGAVRYETFGAAPNRVFGVEYYQIDYGATFQVLLYEGSDIIEVHIVTTGSEGAYFGQGLENSDGTAGVALADRENGVSLRRTLTDDAVRFMPSHHYGYGLMLPKHGAPDAVSYDADHDRYDVDAADAPNLVQAGLLIPDGRSPAETDWVRFSENVRLYVGNSYAEAAKGTTWTVRGSADFTQLAAGEADTSGLTVSSGSPTPDPACSAGDPACAEFDGDPYYPWYVGNGGGVFNGGTPTTITLDRAYWITKVGDYHWNNGSGQPGGGTITIRASDDTTYGPYAVQYPNGPWYWYAYPNVLLPAGIYTIYDSDPSTWSQNGGTDGHGMTWAYGIPDTRVPAAVRGDLQLGLPEIGLAVSPAMEIHLYAGRGFNGQTLDVYDNSASTDGVWQTMTTCVVSDNYCVFSTDHLSSFAVTGGTPVIVSSSHPQPSVSLVEPKGGENLTAGQSYQILWGGTGLASVNLKLSTDGGANYDTVIASGLTGGYYAWTVPARATTRARIMVEGLGDNGAVLASDISPNDFAILVPAVTGGGGGGGGGAPPTGGQPSPPVGGVTSNNPLTRSQANAELPPNYPVDALVKLPGDNDPATTADDTVYYLGLDAKRHPFPSRTIFLSWYQDFSQVQTIDAATLAAIPLGAPILVRPGTHWVKIVSDPRTYYVEPGYKLRWIRDEAAAVVLGGPNWNRNIIDIDPTLFTLFAAGPDLTASGLAADWPAGALVSQEHVSAVYYVAASGRSLLSADGLHANGFQLRFLRTTPAGAGWTAKTVGEPITGFDSDLFSLMH